MVAEDGRRHGPRSTFRRRQQRSAGQCDRSDAGGRSRTRRARSAFPHSSSARRCIRVSAADRCRRSTRPATASASSWSSRTKPTGRPRILPDVRIRNASGKLVPIGAFARVERTAGSLTINQLGQLPAVTISFNLPPGVALGEAVGAHRPAEGGAEPSAHDHHNLFGHGQDLPGIAREPGHPADRGHGDDLYRARHPLRELHPPLHHPDRTAIGGRWARCWRCGCSAWT